MELAGFHQELPYSEFREIAYTFGQIALDAGGRGAVFGRPFAEALAEIVAVPETAVEDLGEFFVPAGYALFGELAAADGLNGFRVGLNGDFDILRTAGAAFDLEHSDSRVDHLVEEVNGLQILRRHDVFVFHGKFVAGLAVGDGVAATAYLSTGSAVGA